MIHYPPLQEYAERYAALPKEPLEIRLTIYGVFGGYDPLALDGLLAWCVVHEATHGRGLPNAEDGYDIPLPLACLWRSHEGFPLWAATQFWPSGHAYDDVSYYHKKAQRGEWTRTKRGRFTITNMTGRYVERRVPMPTHLANHWVAWCLGNPEEIARLLEMLTHIGKRRAAGYGEIRQWVILSASEFSPIRNGVLVRAIPAAAVPEMEGWPSGIIPAGQPVLVGWTPPLWKPALFAPGWWGGTPVCYVNDEDDTDGWFHAVDDLDASRYRAGEANTSYGCSSGAAAGREQHR